MRALELYIGEEIQTLQKKVVKRFETIKEIIGIDVQWEKVQELDLASPVCVNVKDDLPMALCKYPVISSDKILSTKYSSGFEECKWQPIYMSNLKEIKQAIASYSLHSPFDREMVKPWTSSNKTTLHDLFQLVSAVLKTEHKCYKCVTNEKRKKL